MQTMTSEAAKVARVKLDEIVQRGIKSAENTIETIMSRVVTDRVVKTPLVKIAPNVPGDWIGDLKPHGFNIAVGDHKSRLHPFAFDQILQDAEVPKTYFNKLENQARGKPWSRDLIAHSVNTILSHRDKQRNLIRSEADTVKGFVSDKFKRIDSRPLLEAFAESCQANGIKPYEGIATDTKVLVRAVVPQVFEPIPNECMVFGIEWRNSDYGDGGHTLNLTMTRMWCTNLAIADTALRQVHLGKRLHDNIEYSAQTYRLDSQANASALRDTIKQIVGGERIAGMLEAVKVANENELPDDKNVILNRLKRHLSAPDAEKAYDAYQSADVVNLPPGNTVWRLSNALSWIAQAKDVSTDKRLDLQKAAGDLIPRKAANAVEV